MKLTSCTALILAAALSSMTAGCNAVFGSSDPAAASLTHRESPKICGEIQEPDAEFYHHTDNAAQARDLLNEAGMWHLGASIQWVMERHDDERFHRWTCRAVLGDAHAAEVLGKGGVTRPR